jgi:hypothetical protein
MSKPELSLSCLELELRDPHYPDLIEVFDYWQSKCGRRFAPSRADIEPLDLVRTLPRTMLADVLSDPQGFRYRLSGTGISDIHGEELTGLAPLDLKPAEYGRLIHRHYQQCVAERRPLLHVIILDLAHHSRAYARLLLPLSNDGERINMLMAVDSANQDARELREFFDAQTGRKA